jgi:hypothetical protein
MSTTKDVPPKVGNRGGTRFDHRTHLLQESRQLLNYIASVPGSEGKKQQKAKVLPSSIADRYITSVLDSRWILDIEVAWISIPV